MFVSIDKRSGSMNAEIEEIIFDKAEALLLLEKLDGKKHTMLSLTRPDGAQLLVGGGGNGFIVTLMDSAGANYTMIHEDGLSNKLVEICAGGQHGEFSESMVSSADDAFKAVSMFYDKKEEQANFVLD